jgi:positive regulator of sigma E activity
MQDLLGFDKMVTPIIIRILYFLGLLGVLVATVVAQCFPGQRILTGLAILVFGAIMVRVYSELLILLFRIHDNLVSINQQMKDRNSSGQL